MGIAAAIGGIATVAGAAISSGASNHAANVARDAAAQNNALEKQIYDTNKSLIQPTIDRGNQAGDTLQSFLGLGGDPAKSKAALDTFLNSTGYQFNRQQGIDAAEQSASAKGLLNSGAALKSLDEFGTGLANTYGQQYVDNLGSVANRGVQGFNALTGASNTYVNGVSNNNNSAASASANAALASAGQINGLIGNAFNAYGASRGASSFGGGGNAMSGGAAGNPYAIPGFTGVG